MFKLIYDVGYRHYGGLNRVMNRWNLNPAPAEDGDYFFSIHFDFDLETVLKFEELSGLFQNRSKVYIDSLKARELGITNSYDKVFEHLAVNNFYGNTLSLCGSSVDAVIPSDGEVFELLKLLKA